MELRGDQQVFSLAWNRCVLTVAPIRPFMVITKPMRVLPRTHAPIAILQLRPAAIMEEAAKNESDTSS